MLLWRYFSDVIKTPNQLTSHKDIFWIIWKGWTESVERPQKHSQMLPSQNKFHLWKTASAHAHGVLAWWWSFWLPVLWFFDCLASFYKDKGQVLEISLSISVCMCIKCIYWFSFSGWTQTDENLIPNHTIIILRHFQRMCVSAF